MGSSSSTENSEPQVITQLDERTVENLKLAFQELDADHNGCVSLEELVARNQHGDVKLSDELMQQLTTMFNNMDLNHDNKVSLQEYISFVEKQQEEAAAEIKKEEEESAETKASPQRLSGELKLNTSNAGKLAEFQRLFAELSDVQLTMIRVDLREIDSTPQNVVAHKATSAGLNVLIEDTSLDIEGADVGVNIRWLLDNLESLSGKKALWRVLLGVRRDDGVYLYEGVVEGSIVAPRGEGGFGFDPVFLPDGREETLAQAKPDSHSARARAVMAFCEGRSKAVVEPIEDWTGKWQTEEDH